MVVFTQPVAETTNINIAAAPAQVGNLGFNVDDTLTVDYSGGAFSTHHVTFDGGPNSVPVAGNGMLYNQVVPFVTEAAAYQSITVANVVGGTTGLTAAAITPNLANGTITINFTPTGLGTATFTVTGIDSAGNTIIRTYLLTVGTAPITLSPTSLPSGATGINYNQTITVSGGTTPYASVVVTNYTPGTTGLPLSAITANTQAGTIVINGTAPNAGTIAFTVTATDAASNVISQNYSITFLQGYTVTPATLPVTTSGVNYNHAISVSGGVAPYTVFDVTNFNGGTTGMTFADIATNTTEVSGGTFVVDGTPIAPGTVTFTINVTDSNGAAYSMPYSILVNPGLLITPASLPQGTTGAIYNQTIAVTGGTSPYSALTVTNFIDTGTGLTAAEITASLAAGTVVINGTPTGTGSAAFTVNVTDGSGATLTQNYTIQVNPALSITAPPLPQATAGTTYSQAILVSGGTTPYSTLTVTGFSAGGTGMLAAQIVPNAAAGTVVINGTPFAAGTAAFTVNVTDAAGATLSQAYSITVNPAPLVIGPAALPQATAGTTYTHTITVSGGTGPYTTFTVTPITGVTGLGATLNKAAGTIVISGAPAASGTASFTVNVTDSAGASLSKTYTITVNAALSITAPPLPQGTAGATYNHTITVSGGTTPNTTFTVTNFSDSGTGLTASEITATAAAGTVVIDGTPTGAGTASFTVNVTDTAGATLTQAYTITVNLPLSSNPTPLTLAEATAGTAYTSTITVTGGTKPYSTFVVGAFNAGGTGLLSSAITPNAAAGTFTISGTPSAAGIVSFTLDVTDAAGAGLATNNYTLTVNQSLSITGSPLPQATALSYYSQAIAVSGGTTPYATLTVTGFSDGGTGLSTSSFFISPALGTVAINGTPTEPGTATFTVNVTDAAGATLSQPYSLTVLPAPLSFSPTALPVATAGINFIQTLTLIGGTAPYAALTVTNFNDTGTGFTADEITPNVAAGTVFIDGTPTGAGTATFTVNVTDNAGATLSQNYSLTAQTPGITVNGSVLEVVGGPTSNYIHISAVGASTNGNSGVLATATINGQYFADEFFQPFSSIQIQGFDGNDYILEDPGLTIPTDITEGNGNNVIQLAGGNDVITVGSGNNQIAGGGGNKTVTALDQAGAKTLFSWATATTSSIWATATTRCCWATGITRLSSATATTSSASAPAPTP